MWPARIIALIPFFLLHSCMKDEELRDFLPPPEVSRGRGVFVVNEGNFMYSNASLSYYDPSTGEVLNDVFYRTNGLPLGDVAHSMTIRDSTGYVVVNNSGKIYNLSTGNFRYRGKITGLTSPRYMHVIHDSKAYVTDLYAGKISIINPLTYMVTGTINLGGDGEVSVRHPAEMMVQTDRYVYTNCWSYDRLVLIIDTETDRLVDSIEVLKQPNSMALDKQGALWVLTDGGVEGSPYGHEDPGLLRVGPGEREAEIIRRFARDENPINLTINRSRDTLYFINRHIYRQAIYPGSEAELVISGSRQGTYGGFYSMAVDPVTSEIYVADAIDHVQRGVVYRYLPGGEPADTFKVGISPGAFCFKP